MLVFRRGASSLMLVFPLSMFVFSQVHPDVHPPQRLPRRLANLLHQVFFRMVAPIVLNQLGLCLDVPDRVG